ncbi:uncharacterized protein F5147DRAFT_775270 [Suillus discolor]|uniref:Uncharacterized protein n=1 Tax=Suillus discolor TaxID=1912936 RepID=A0A9P7F5C8_9AGAM|nr:uncharacterized protein F5147DRAFT_775270 [Suillus discolor]KAG2105495.1 hypothetical protein F5147DRAFT_775270 [Suillus discolor]
MSNDAGAALANEFTQLSFDLRNAFDQSTEYRSLQIHQLTMQWDDVVSPHISRLLLPPPFSDIQRAAEGGPAIIPLTSQKLAVTRVSDGHPTAESTLLALHAAVILREKEKPQIYFSSSTPTLATLIHARQQVS